MVFQGRHPLKYTAPPVPPDCDADCLMSVPMVEKVDIVIASRNDDTQMTTEVGSNGTSNHSDKKQFHHSLKHVAHVVSNVSKVKSNDVSFAPVVQ